MLLGSSGNNSQYSTDEFAELLHLETGSIQFIEERIPEEANDMKCVMLQMSDGAAWPDQVQIARERFKQPFHPYFVGASPALDGYRILCDRLCDHPKKKPNIAIVHLQNAQDARTLFKQLAESEDQLGLCPLPAIVITPDMAEMPGPAIAGDRATRLLPSPFSLSRLVDSVNELITNTATLHLK